MNGRKDGRSPDSLLIGRRGEGKGRKGLECDSRVSRAQDQIDSGVGGNFGLTPILAPKRHF
jgi:hypothetical protein